MKNFWKRSLAFLLALLMVIGVLPASGWTKPVVGKAEAATRFTTEEWQKCFTKVLLSQVGKGYGASGGTTSGYIVGGSYVGQNQSDRVTSGTPYSPANLSGNASYDCFGLVVTALMAMGYDYFTDGTHTYPLNGHYGGGIFNRQSCSGDMRSILYDHGTGDKILLHHSNDSKYNVWFIVGEIVDKGTNDNEVKAGDLLFTLTEEDPLNTKKTPGPFSAGQIYNVNHGAVALFTLKRNDMMPQRADYAVGNISAAAIGYSSASPARR